MFFHVLNGKKYANHTVLFQRKKMLVERLFGRILSVIVFLRQIAQHFAQCPCPIRIAFLNDITSYKQANQIFCMLYHVVSVNKQQECVVGSHQNWNSYGSLCAGDLPIC